MALNPVVNLDRCCRLCAEEQEVTIMIFSEEAQAMLLQNKLNKYLLIEVDVDDKLPKDICIRCCTKLQTVCDFIDTARKAQEILMKRSLMLDQGNVNYNNTSIKTEPMSDDETKITEIEVNVDPMMILQNCEDLPSPLPNQHFVNYNCNTSSCFEDVTNLHSADGEYVTIKLIRKEESSTTNTDCMPDVKPMISDNYEDGDSEKEDITENPLNTTERNQTKPFQCPMCRRSFLSELALKNHSWVHINDDKSIKLYRCTHCSDSFDYKSDLITHLKEHRTQGMCKKCGRIFRTPANLAAHMAIHASAGKSFTCKVCGRSYGTQSNLTTHSITHSNERPYNCHLCKKSFKRNQDLKFHINQHTGAKPYKCPFCDKSFASSGNCYSHRSRMHPGRHVDNKKIIRQPSRRKMTGLHESEFEPKVPPPKTILNKGIFRYQCTLCDHSFVRRDNYTYHMYQHTGTKPFHCTFCTEKFVTRKGLLLHHDKEHPGQNRPLALLSKNVLLK
ncbi:hypothetical protein O0L34_g9741 [Tuta absoluta]|nr:hypothetical protein O0L34_g9741 [Tuta absoluta]